MSSPTPASQPSRFPVALVLALTFCAGLSGLTWLLASSQMGWGQRHLVILGDSGVGNFRLPEGSRLEDRLRAELGRGWAVHNLARPNAFAADYYLELCEAEFLGVKPDVVVVAMSPQKLVRGEKVPKRFTENGAFLRWLPLNQEGYALFASMDEEERQLFAVKKLGLLFGFVDGIDALWYDLITRPRQHAKFVHSNPKQHKRDIKFRARRIAGLWNGLTLGTYTKVFSTRNGKDLEFLFRALKARPAQTVVVIHPDAHPGLVPKLFTAKGQANLDHVYQYMLTFMQAQGFPVVDFNAPSEAEQFKAERWDDLHHLKSPATFKYMAHKIASAIQSRGERRASHD